MTKTSYEDLIRAIDEHSCLNFLARMVRFKSYSNTTGETELSRFMVEQMDAIGLTAELQHVEEARYNAIGCWRGAGGGKCLLFNGQWMVFWVVCGNSPRFHRMAGQWITMHLRNNYLRKRV